MRQPPLGVGIVGAGNILKRHALAYKCLPELATLIAVADVERGRAESARGRYGFMAAYSDHRELLSRDDIAVVSVCTPANAHAGIVVDALEAGKHVLCEKPLALSLAQVDEIIFVSARTPDRLVSVIYQYRSDPAHARTRALIAHGELGRVLLVNVRVRAQRTPAYYATALGRGAWSVDGGGVLFNQAIHQLDALISFLGDPVQASACMATFMQPTQAEDSLVGWVRFASGAFACIECTVCAHEDRFTIEVLGDNAAIEITGDADATNCGWKLSARSSAAERALIRSGMAAHPRPPESSLWIQRAQKVICKLRGRDWLPPRHWGHTPHIREFLMALQSRGASPVPPVAARKSIELAMAMYGSALIGIPVSLPLSAGESVYQGVDAVVSERSAESAGALSRRDGSRPVLTGPRIGAH